MTTPVEKRVPSTSSGLLRGALAADLLVFLVVLAIFIRGLLSGDMVSTIFGLYGVLMSALCGYLLLKQIGNPDRLYLDETGFTYEFLNITFRVGWGDIEEMRLKDSRVIQVRLSDAARVAFASRVGKQRLMGRTMFNPYTRASLADVLMLRGLGPKDSADLARLLDETAKHSGFHIQIPVLESPQSARELFDEMGRRRAEWQPPPVTFKEDMPALSSEQPPPVEPRPARLDRERS
jgi:hypothetical protein